MSDHEFHTDQIELYQDDNSNFYSDLDERLSSGAKLKQHHYRDLSQDEHATKFTAWLLRQLVYNPEEAITAVIKILDPGVTYNELGEMLKCDRQTAFRRLKRFVVNNPKFKALIEKKEKSDLELDAEKVVAWWERKHGLKTSVAKRIIQKYVRTKHHIDDVLDLLIDQKKVSADKCRHYKSYFLKKK